MEKTLYTPGPWEQNYICQGSTNEIKANGKRIALVLQYDENQNHVAHFRQCEANARLMAAAPDLLEALIALKTANGANDFEGWHDAFKPAIALANAAIAKAKGGAQ